MRLHGWKWRGNNMVWIGYGLAWLSTALAISVGIYYTHSAWCLWALILLACIGISQGKEEGNDKDE